MYSAHLAELPRPTRGYGSGHFPEWPTLQTLDKIWPDHRKGTYYASLQCCSQHVRPSPSPSTPLRCMMRTAYFQRAAVLALVVRLWIKLIYVQMAAPCIRPIDYIVTSVQRTAKLIIAPIVYRLHTSPSTFLTTWSTVQGVQMVLVSALVLHIFALCCAGSDGHQRGLLICGRFVHGQSTTSNWCGV